MSPSRVLFIGRATLDVVYSVDHFPAEDTKVFARAMRVAPGGPATNAAITHALLGGKTALMTAIGGGPWARPVREELDGLGIDLIDLAAGSSYQTPLTTVLVNESAATRTIVNPPQLEVALKTVEAWNPAWGAMPGLVLTDGFHLHAALPLLRSLRTAGAQICLDGGSWKPGTEELAPRLAVAICSERFALPGRQANADDAIAWFAGVGVPHIAITRGPQPIVGWDLHPTDENLSVGTPGLHPTDENLSVGTPGHGRRFAIEIEKIEAVDTLGAGDVLHGAFCYEFNGTGEFEPALRKAAQIATRSCRGLGIRCGTECS